MYARRKSAAFVLFLFAVALSACLPSVAAAIEQPVLSVAATPATLTCGAQAQLTVQGATAGAPLTLYRKRASDADFVKIADAIATADGSFSRAVKPADTTVYRVDEGDGQGGTIASAETTVSVRHRVTLAAVSAKPLIEGRPVRYTVTVRPAHVGGIAQLQSWDGEAWQPLADVKLGAESAGSVRLPAGKPGVLRVRAQMAADGGHLSGASKVWRRTVFDKRNPYGVPTRYAHLILVDLSKYRLYYHEHGIVIRAFDCVLGRPSLPTPRGHYRIYAKDPHMSGAYGPYRMRYLGLYAIHGTNEPWLLNRFPRNYSHGCTRLSNTNITWLFQRVPVGTPVWNVP